MSASERGLSFGTDGIRGKAGSWPCTPEVGVAVGRAAAKLARTRGGDRVLVARDTRPSGEMLEAAVTAGVAGAGFACLLAGVLPTSGVALALRRGLADVGVMVTASHNPAGDNGFKLLGPGGAKLSDDEQRAVERWLAEAPADTEVVGDVADAQHDAWAAWEDAITGAFPEPEVLRGRKIALDLANGALVPAAPWLVRNVPATWVLVGEGTGTINDRVGSEHLGALQAAVRAHGCDAGIAVDGDADRCRLVDERGEVVPGDAVAWLLARARGVRGLAVTVMSNGALEKQLPGVDVRRTAVGDRFVREEMDRAGLELGSEESGHVLFSDFPAGDGLLTGLRTLAALGRGRASEVFGGFAPLPRWAGKLPVARRVPLEDVEGLAALVAARERELGAFGRVFLRYSGTEPVLRLLIEGEDAAVVARVGPEVRDYLARRLA